MAEMLLYVDSDEVAANLYKVMNEFLEDIRKSKREIWPPNTENTNSDEDLNSPSITSAQRVIPPNLIGKDLFLEILHQESLKFILNDYFQNRICCNLPKNDLHTGS